MKTFGPLILLVVFLWVFMLRPQKKKDKEVKEMRNNIVPGDELVTIGGVIGKVLSVKEDSFVMYVGNDKTKMEFKKWAISEVTKKAAKAETKAEEPAEETEKKKIRKLTKKADASEEKAE
ncbi:MAG: preprotein translocase subunit YajC [Firmicutes bacterium]|nr:preprotein translocase subunit YajC [Bacillota bacterium]